MVLYKLLMGIGIILVCIILWIPLNETVSDSADILNGMTTNSGVIERNNIAAQAFYYSLLFIMLIFGIYIMISSLQERELGVAQ